MTSLVDRLRGVVRPGAGPEPADQPFYAENERQSGRAPVEAAANTLGGEWIRRCGAEFLVVERSFTPGYRHGRATVADAFPPDAAPWPRLPLLAGQRCGGRMLFIDLETTGLAGGAGTYAFLIGCAWFDGARLRTRQLVLTSFAAEHALLDTLAEIARSCGTIVTYNGKSFDLPLLETRYAMHRQPSPFEGMPHVDMVHPARRLWRHCGEDCRLIHLEEALCGFARDGDVAGYEIPSRYFRYVRSGDAAPLAAVLEHNRLDLLSLAFVAARATRLLDEGPVAAQSAREALGLARIYERAGLMADAAEAYARAVHMADDDLATRADALRGCAVIARRQRRHEHAAAAWRSILDLTRCPAALAREASEALAVHHEHRLRDPRSARRFALQSIKLQPSPSRRGALEHRVARLNRKLEEAHPRPIPLF